MRGIGHAGLGETLGAQAAGIAMPAGAALGIGLVAAHGGGEVHAQAHAFTHDVTLAHLHQGAWMRIPAPSTPALVATLASDWNASMNAGRQSG